MKFPESQQKLQIKCIYRQHSTRCTSATRNVYTSHVTLLQQKGVLRFKQRWWWGGGGVIVLNNLLAEHFIRMLAAAHQILCATFSAEGFTIFIKCLAR